MDASNKKITISIKTATIVGVVIVALAILFAIKGLFIAAMVNGSPISRLSVIQELERNSGKAALESLIVKKLINNEANKNDIKVTDDEVNIEIANAEAQIKSQGGTLEEALASQGMTLEILKKQIAIQKKLEGLLADKIQVTDADKEKFIADNKIEIPKGEEVSYDNQITQEIKQQKLNAESKTFVDSLKAANTIRYFVSY
ncbi:MAG: SurA N-terminal domain-containing protein [bacterium]|nr:SurA N-terminal domain-containing protein [bacterium]